MFVHLVLSKPLEVHVKSALLTALHAMISQERVMLAFLALHSISPLLDIVAAPQTCLQSLTIRAPPSKCVQLVSTTLVTTYATAVAKIAQLATPILDHATPANQLSP